MKIPRRRRLVAAALALIAILGTTLISTWSDERKAVMAPPTTVSPQQMVTAMPALEALNTLSVKGRASKTGYSRAQFGDGWRDAGNCDIRNLILARDMENEQLQSETDCRVIKGTLHDPYTATTIEFVRGAGTSDDVQIDHVVALSDAWQKGAQQLTSAMREDFANDPLNLLAVEGKANMDKSDADAATWLPPNKDYRCRYVARQIAVKVAYHLWVTAAERDAMAKVLSGCPDQRLPIKTPAN
ncbi:MAG TPA: HNH endonuclease family protein [Candidatus Saccharimonadales bacterium]